MQVFSSSQQQFKLQLDPGSQASTVSVSPPLLTPSPAQTPLMPPKKRKLDSIPVTSSLLSPSSSSTSSMVISPESNGGGRQNSQGDASHGSETDDASECPPELIQERLIRSRPRRTQTRDRNVQHTPLSKLQEQATYFQQHPCNGRVSFCCIVIQSWWIVLKEIWSQALHYSFLEFIKLILLYQL
jgi:hypothetical protein